MRPAKSNKLWLAVSHSRFGFESSNSLHHSWAPLTFPLGKSKPLRTRDRIHYPSIPESTAGSDYCQRLSWLVASQVFVGKSAPFEYYYSYLLCFAGSVSFFSVGSGPNRNFMRRALCVLDIHQNQYAVYHSHTRLPKRSHPHHPNTWL